MAPAFVYFLGAKSVIHSSGGLGGSVFDVTPILSLLRITNTEAIIREEDQERSIWASVLLEDSYVVINNYAPFSFRLPLNGTVYELHVAHSSTPTHDHLNVRLILKEGCVSPCDCWSEIPMMKEELEELKYFLKFNKLDMTVGVFASVR